MKCLHASTENAPSAFYPFLARQLADSVQQILSCPGAGLGNTEAMDVGKPGHEGGPCGGGQPANALRALTGNLKFMGLAKSSAEENGAEAIVAGAYASDYNGECEAVDGMYFITFRCNVMKHTTRHTPCH